MDRLKKIIIALQIRTFVITGIVIFLNIMMDDPLDTREILLVFALSFFASAIHAAIDMRS